MRDGRDGRGNDVEALMAEERLGAQHVECIRDQQNAVYTVLLQYFCGELGIFFGGARIFFHPLDGHRPFPGNFPLHGDRFHP